MASLVAGMGPALLFAAIHAIGAGVLMGQSFSFTLFALVGSLAGIFGLGKRARAQRPAVRWAESWRRPTSSPSPRSRS